MTLDIGTFKSFATVKDGLLFKKKVNIDNKTMQPVIHGFFGRVVRFLSISKSKREKLNAKSVESFISAVNTSFGANIAKNIRFQLHQNRKRDVTLSLKEVKLFVKYAEELHQDALISQRKAKEDSILRPVKPQKTSDRKSLSVDDVRFETLADIEEYRSNVNLLNQQIYNLPKSKSNEKTRVSFSQPASRTSSPDITVHNSDITKFRVVTDDFDVRNSSAVDNKDSKISPDKNNLEITQPRKPPISDNPLRKKIDNLKKSFEVLDEEENENVKSPESQNKTPDDHIFQPSANQITDTTDENQDHSSAVVQAEANPDQQSISILGEQEIYFDTMAPPESQSNKTPDDHIFQPSANQITDTTDENQDHSPALVQAEANPDQQSISVLGDQEIYFDTVTPPESQSNKTPDDHILQPSANQFTDTTVEIQNKSTAVEQAEADLYLLQVAEFCDKILGANTFQNIVHSFKNDPDTKKLMDDYDIKDAEAVSIRFCALKQQGKANIEETISQQRINRAISDPSMNDAGMYPMIECALRGLRKLPDDKQTRYKIIDNLRIKQDYRDNWQKKAPAQTTFITLPDTTAKEAENSKNLILKYEFEGPYCKDVSKFCATEGNISNKTYLIAAESIVSPMLMDRNRNHAVRITYKVTGLNFP